MSSGLTATSPLLLNIARDAVHQSRLRPNDALVAIVFSAAALEGYFNEISEMAESGPAQRDESWATFITVMKEAERSRAQLTSKIQFASLALSGKSFPRGTAIHQDVELLLQVRNALMHLKAITYELPEGGGPLPEDKIIKSLKSRGVLREDDLVRSAAWTQVIANPRVARWAFNSVVNMVAEIRGLFPQGLVRIMMLFHWEDVRPIE